MSGGGYQSVRKGLRILRALRGHSVQGLANRDIAAAADLSAVDVSRLVGVLLDEGFVTRLETGRYALSVQMLQIAQAHAEDVALAQARIAELNQRVSAGAGV